MMAGEERRTAAAVLGLPEPERMPASIEGEQAVLGALLLDNGLFSKVSDLLTPDAFFEPLHRRVFEVLKGLIEQQKIANAITIKDYLGDQDLGGVTVGAYLARLRAEAAVSSEVRGHAEMLHHLRIRREVIAIAQEALEQAYHARVEDTAKGLVEGALDRLGALNIDPREVSGFQDFQSASYRALMLAQSALQRGGAIPGLSTGLPRLDDVLGGLQDTDLIILAGRPGMGKTSLATNIAFNVALDLEARRAAGERTGVVGFFSMEMSDVQLAQRILSDQTGITPWKIRRGIHSVEEMERLVEAQRLLNRIPLFIDKSAGINIATLRMRARDLKKKRGLRLIVVDYLQLLSGSKAKDNRTQELTEITTGLKALAKDLNVPVVALSQLSRKVEERDDHRPMLSDLRESGSIEQDADVVMFVYREEYYLGKLKPPAEGTEARFNYERKLAKAKGVAEVIVGKNRHGPDGTVELGFVADVTRFTNEPEPREEWAEEAKAEKREKPKTLSVKAMQCLKILRGLQQSHPTLGQELENVPSIMKRPVSYMLWRERCAADLLDTTRGEKEAAKLMETVVPELKEFELIIRAGTKDHPYVACTTKGETYG